MNEKSFELFSKEHTSSEKFDYFVCSVAGALFAYIGQTYTPHTFDSWFYYLTPISLLSLTLCFCCGFILIRLSNDITRLNKEVLLAHEECDNFANLLLFPPASIKSILGQAGTKPRQLPPNHFP